MTDTSPPLPMLDTKCFDRFCYALVRAHGGAVRYWKPRTAGDILFHFWD